MTDNKVKTMVYVVLRILVVAVMIAQIFNHNWNNVFLCIMTLILFMVPIFIDKRLHIELPNTLEIIILIFIFAAEILGEIHEYYLIFPSWDMMLHTMNGFLCAGIGFSLIDILNESEHFSIRLSPIFLALVSFSFSMTVGVLWEFFEFAMDCFMHTDMQKDTILRSVTSLLLQPGNENVPVTVPIESIVVNGESWDYGGYIDIGLYDTMTDLFVNFIGAVSFCMLGLFYIKGRGNGSFSMRFIPRRREPELVESEEENKESSESKKVV